MPPLVKGVTTIPQHASLERLCEEAQEGATPAQIAELNAAKNYIIEKNLPEGSEIEIKAFKRAADAIKNGIRVFISYKFIHSERAKRFRDKICAYGQSRFARDQNNQPDVYLAEQRVGAGTPWRKDIREAIEKAHWFFVLLPNIESDRDWLGHEAGYFERGMSATSERLICIHHPSTATAKPLAEYLAYVSSAEGLKQLFTQLFFEENVIPGMKQITYDGYKENLPRDTEELSKLFHKGMRPVVPEICGRFIEIEHRDGIRYDKIEDLLSAQILNMKNLTEAFDRPDTFRGKFGDLIASVNDRDHGQQWIDALCGALHDLVTDHLPRAVRVPFFGAKRGWAFRPNLYGVWRNTENKQIDHFQVIFTEEIGERVVNVPEELDALETSLRWAYRSWWEIYGSYDRRLTVEDVEDIYRYTQRAEQEVQSRGAMDPEIMLGAFKDEEKKVLRDQYTKYFTEYRNPQTNNGKIDRAFRDRDPKLMKECLDELRPNSRWFLKTAAKRFGDLIGEKIPDKG